MIISPDSNPNRHADANPMMPEVLKDHCGLQDIYSLIAHSGDEGGLVNAAAKNAAKCEAKLEVCTNRGVQHGVVPQCSRLSCGGAGWVVG